MDHREQMQREAEQWQAKSIILIRIVRYGVLTLGILVVLVLFLRNLGFPKEIHETLPATVITESGQTLECTLEIRGEVTDYPLNKDKAGADDKVVIYANEKRLVEAYYKQGGENLFARRGDTVCLLKTQRDAMVLETDIQNIFPDMESQRCLVYYGCDSFDIPGEYAELFAFFQN